MPVVKTIEEFTDKVVGRDRLVGDVFEVSDERAKVLLGDNDYQRAFVEVVPGDELPDNGGDDESATVDYEKMKTADLKALLTEKGIAFDDKAKKPELLDLLAAAE